jgi:hypothetical protein
LTPIVKREAREALAQFHKQSAQYSIGGKSHRNEFALAWNCKGSSLMSFLCGFLVGFVAAILMLWVLLWALGATR